MSGLFMAKFPKTGEWLSRDGIAIAATREEWATLSPTFATDLSAVPDGVETVPLFDGPLKDIVDAHKANNP